MKPIFVIALLLAAPRVSSATVIEVFPDGSGDAPTIAAALVIALPGDDISLGPGTFYENDLVWKNGVALISQTGDPATTFIDAQQLGRCIDLTNVTGQRTIRGITFMNGTTTGVGGLVKGDNCRYLFQACVFRNGSANQGGAVGTTLGSYLFYAPSAINCLFEDNTATSGGAICWNGFAGVGDCTFRGNSATNGGAAYVQKPPYSEGQGFGGCVFSDNQATEDGGAIFTTGNQGEGGAYIPYGVWIQNCDFRNNQAQNGGAVRLSQYDMATGSIYIENIATNAGGAIYAADFSVTPGEVEAGEISYSTIARNTAAYGGGITFSGGGPFYFQRNTIVANEAPSGSNIGLQGSVATPYNWISNTILAFGVGGAAVAGTGVFEVGCFDVYGNEGGDWVGPLAGQLGTNNNISADPLFCDAASDNYYLTVGSPCIAPQCYEQGSVIGVYGTGCQPPNSVEALSWGRIKGLHAPPR
jgi:predicted outer membrane repeat protein